MAEKKLLMVTVSGPDRPGITASLTRILVEHKVEIVDVEQSSLRKLLGLYFLLDMSEALETEDSVIKDLLYEASRLDLTLNFRLYSENEVDTSHQQNLFVLTHFGGTRALAEISEILAKENVNIQSITTTTHHETRSIELIINTNNVRGIGHLKEKIMVRSRELGIDLAIQKMEAYRKNKRLILFDMDSTLLDMEIIDEMAKHAGVHREVSRITEKAMRGDFDFESSLRQRVALLKGLTEEALMEIRDNMAFSHGVEDLVVTLKWLGYKMGIITGGFDFFAENLKGKFDFDFVYANRLEIKNGALTGRVIEEIIDAPRKAQIVSQLSCDLGIPLDQVVVVGDGANDALMLGQAGLGIAYNAKKVLERVAGASLGKTHLPNILHLLAITEEDITEATGC